MCYISGACRVHGQVLQGMPFTNKDALGASNLMQDVTRNVERLDHLDDPKQRKIYEAEVQRVSVSEHAALSQGK